MYDLEPFKIDLKGLHLEAKSYTFNLDDAFFDATNSPDIVGGKVLVMLRASKKNGFYELGFHYEGKVSVLCDVCLERLEQTICFDDELIVKYGMEFIEDEGFITIDKNDEQLDISWFICEALNLRIPLKHVHQSGECNKEMENILKKISIEKIDKKNTLANSPLGKELEKLRNIIKD